MLYEVRTYDIKPYSELAAFWHTEIGPLNQIIHVWPYKDLEERAKIRAAAVKDGGWPPPIGEFIVAQRSDIMVPFDLSPQLKPGRMGPYFEMRIYTYGPGALPKIMAAWEKAIPARIQYSPLCAAWYSELGSLGQFVHIWPYPSLDARNKTRQETQAAGVWPPSAIAKKDPAMPTYDLTRQENKILMPSAFSPLQ
jgi:hypothetical protein